MNKKNILLFIPTLNEERHIKLILDKIEIYNEYIDLLVIDDNSSDNTIENFNKHKGAIDKKLIVRKDKFGIGSAHLDAIQYAKSNHYKYILTMDCDFTHDPKYISNFLDLYKKYDFLVGSRYLLKDSLSSWSQWRIFLSYTAHYICKIFLNISFDTTSGFRMYNLQVINDDFFNLVQNYDYSFFIQSGFYIRNKKLKIKEIPVKMPIRKYGNSKMRIKHIKNSLILVLKLWLSKFKY